MWRLRAPQRWKRQTEPAVAYMVSIEEAHLKLTEAMASQPPHPVGIIAFRLTSEGLANHETKAGIILQLANGAHVFRIEREGTPRVSFYHWSPGTGSRCASVDVAGMRGSADVRVVATWSPRDTALCIMPFEGSKGEVRWAKGVASHRQFRVTRNGKIIQIGDHGVEVMQPRSFEAGRLVLEPTALELWQGVEAAVQILLSGDSKDGYMYEVVQTNYALTGLVTWYLQKKVFGA